MVAHASNPSTPEERQEDLCWILGQSDLYSEFQDSQIYRDRLCLKKPTQ